MNGGYERDMARCDVAVAALPPPETDWRRVSFRVRRVPVRRAAAYRIARALARWDARTRYAQGVLDIGALR